MQKRVYRIENWPEYNRALVQRGSITIWIEDEALKNWFCKTSTGRAGRPETYSNDAILMLLILRERFGLTLRSLQGFAISLFLLMNLTLPIPSYTQICRRAQSLHKKIPRLKAKGVRHLVFDSTGLKVYGEGEWKVKVHGKSKRRTWRKFHMGIDGDSQDIVAYELTGNHKGDAEVAIRLMDQLPTSIKSVRADGAYDADYLRARIDQIGARAIIPPPRNAAYKGAKEGWERARDASIAEIAGLGGDEDARRLWKLLTGYHKRSLVETAIYRIKQILGSRLKSRGFNQQVSEAHCKCLVINRMNKLGLPKGRWVLADAA